MKLSFIIVLLSLLLGSNSLYAQCRDFAKEVCKPQLGSYVHDGNFNSVVLNAGEEVELHKAFFSGQKYRMVVCPEEHLPAIHFKVLNSKLEVIFDNKNAGYGRVFDFELQESDTLIISLEFLEKGEKYDQNINGCVALLFGLEM